MAGKTIALHVSVTGSDRNPGTAAKPFKTPERARREVRRSKIEGRRVTVVLRGGIYERKKPFVLEAEDSGTEKHPVVWRSAEGELARFVGGKRIDGEAFQPVTSKSILNRIISTAARKRVMQVDLRALGVRSFGKLGVRGFGGKTQVAHMELFFDGKPMQLACYPNEGGFLRVAADATGDSFRCRSQRAKLWKKADDVWLHGYWKWIWADLYVPVKSWDAKTGTFTLQGGHTKEFGKGKPFYAINLLEEISRPGDWYLDRKTGILYFWPPVPNGVEGPSDPTKADICVSIMSEPLLRVDGAKHLRFEGLAFEVARGRLAITNDADDVIFRHCIFRNSGSVSVNVRGRRSGLDRCEIAHSAEAGVILTGGDRPTLTPGENFVTHCHLHHFGRWCKTYTPGAGFQGVGHTIAHNHIHDGPHNALLFSGNDHLIEYNHIHDVGQYASNGGAVYVGLGWDQRGSIIRYNYLHDIKGRIPGGQYGIMGIYLDDCNSGNTIHGNIITDLVGWGILIGGGRDNTVTNNIVCRCGEAIAIDSRGLERITDAANSHWNMLKWMKHADIHYRKPPWSTAYPQLAAIPDSFKAVCAGRWRYPEGNVISRNVGWKNGKFWLTEDNGGDGTLAACKEIKDNLEDANPQFVSERTGNVALKPGSPALKIKGFKRIPVEKIGVEK